MELIYKLFADIPAVGTVPETVAALQSAYDNGAAGFFEVTETVTGYRVEFQRDIGEDMECIGSGMLTPKNTRDQLADEFEECGDGPIIKTVIDALRDPAQIASFALCYSE